MSYYNRKSALAHRERCSRAGIASGKARRAKMMLSEAEDRPRSPGEFIGVLEWRGKDEAVRRWIVRQGPRRNNIRLDCGKTGGWDWLLSKLRKRLAPLTFGH